MSLTPQPHSSPFISDYWAEYYVKIVIVMEEKLGVCLFKILNSTFQMSHYLGYIFLLKMATFLLQTDASRQNMDIETETMLRASASATLCCCCYTGVSDSVTRPRLVMSCGFISVGNFKLSFNCNLDPSVAGSSEPTLHTDIK